MPVPSLVSSLTLGTLPKFPEPQIPQGAGSEVWIPQRPMGPSPHTGPLETHGREEAVYVCLGEGWGSWSSASFQ